MGQVSHMDELRQLIKKAGRPPVEGGRKCSGTISRGGRWVSRWANNEYTSEWIDQTDEPCRNGASPWIPELGWCASHLPMPVLAVANARAELWASLCSDIWQQVVAECPLPPDALPEED
jgi:hypothetical protein